MTGLGINFFLVTSQYATGVVMLLAAAIVVSLVRETQNKMFWLFGVNWVCWAAAWFLSGTAHLLYEPLLMIISYIPQCVGVSFLLAFLDYVERESVNPLKVGILSAICALYIWTSWMPGAVEVWEDYGVHVAGASRVFQLIFLVFYIVVYLRWTILTRREAPEEIQGAARLFLVGGVIFSIVSVFLYFLGSFVPAMNALAFPTQAFGAMITVIALWREPKLAYLLPFKALRLMVVDTNAGLPIFTHTWKTGKNMAHEDLFSGMLYGVDSIVETSLQRGQICEIHTAHAILLIERSEVFPVICALAATRSSNVLREALTQFAKRFFEEFHGELGRPHEVSLFKRATPLVFECFPFVPEYGAKE